MCSLALKYATGFIAFFMSGVTAFCQSDALALSSGATSPGGAVSLNLSLSSASGSQPAGIEWTLAYSPSNIVSISASAGAAATAAGKSLSCTGSPGSYMCFLAGLSSGDLNANLIQNGVIAVVTATLSATSSGTTINVTNALSTSAAGSAIQTTATGGTIATIVPLSLTSLSCNPGSVTSGASATCTVTVNQSASAATTVTLSSNNALLTIPSLVTILTGASSANFIATAGVLPSNQSAAISATLNGTLETTTLSLVDPAVVTALACNPASVNSGAASTCTITLNEAAQSNGSTVSLSSNNAALTVPASVTVPANSTSATFSATAGTITTSQSATITSILNGASQNATLSLVAPTLVSAFACNPAGVNPGASSTCTVTLSQPAPSGGSAIGLSSNNAALTVPASITVPANSTSAAFSATVGTIATNQTGTVTATLGSSSQSATLSLVAPTLVSTLACNPTSVNSAASSTCTITLSQAAPVGGSAVGLSSNNTALTVPASFTVPAASSSATFSGTVGTITTNQTATVTATLGSSSQSASLSLVAPTLVSTLACNPTSVNAGAPSACTITLSQAAPAGGSAVGLSSNNTALTVPASVTVPANSTSATFSATVGTIATTQSATVTATLNGASQSASLSMVAPVLVSALTCNPTTLNANASSTCTVSLNQAAPPAGATVALSGNNALLTVPATVSVAAGAMSAPFTATAENIATSQSVTVTASLNNGSQTASLSLAAPVLVSTLACNPGVMVSGNASTCTVTLNQPAASGGSIVALSDNSSLVTLPANVTVPAGVTSATFTATAEAKIAKLTVALTATLDGASQTTSLLVLPTPAVSSLSCNPTSLTSGSSAACTVTLSRDVYALREVQLNANSSLLTIPTSLSVASGTASATFTAIAGVVTTSQSGTITAGLDTAGVSSSISTTLNLSPVLPSALSCDTTSLTAGSTSTCTLTLSSPAPTGGVTVAVSSDGPALTVPPSVNIPASASTGTFAVTAATGSPSGKSTVAVSASLFGASQSASFTVTICPCSVLSLSAQPSNPDTNDNQAIEVGMQFITSMSGYVTGVRFFKSLNNTGTHVGHLWDTKGNLLASVAFTDETPSGWQAAYFPSPVAVEAHAAYVISYNAPNGNYAADSGSFTNALSSPPLVGLPDGANGPNGVYQYGSGQFPTTGAAATNFWVDVVFNTSPTIGMAAPVSLWTPQAVPNTPAAPTTQAAQLGLSFIPNVAGYVTGLRFYKSSSNLGQHIGYLWSSTGTLLASVSFIDESTSGWQQANFATPVAVTANTPYVISYWAPRGYYADDAGYFATAGLTNQMLYAPPDGQYGPNGSYAAGKTFPASSSAATNYWVDVVFTTAIQ